MFTASIDYVKGCNCRESCFKVDLCTLQLLRHPKVSLFEYFEPSLDFGVYLRGQGVNGYLGANLEAGQLVKDVGCLLEPHLVSTTCTNQPRLQRVENIVPTGALGMGEADDGVQHIVECHYIQFV